MSNNFNISRMQELYKDIFENLICSIILLEPIKGESDNIVDYIVRYINKSGITYFQGTVEIPGKKLSEIFPVNSGILINKCNIVFKEGIPEKILFNDNKPGQDFEMIISRLNDAVTLSWNRKSSDEQRYRNALDSIKEGCAIIDFNWTYIYVNEANARHAHLKSEDMIGRKMLDVIPGVENSLFFSYYKLCMEERSSHKFEANFTFADGSVAWYEVIVQPVPEGIFVISMDITNRKQAEESLLKSEEHYRTLFNAIDEGFCIIEMLFDQDGKPVDYLFLEVNPAFEKHSGIINGQGKRIREVAPLNEEYWFEIYGNVAITGEPARFQNRAAQLNRWFDVYAFSIGRTEERKVAILFNDISQQKIAEESLKESQERFSKAFITNPNAIVISKIADGTIMEVNESFIKLFGFARNEIIGKTSKSLNMFVSPDEREKAITILKNDKRIRDFEIKIRTKSGEELVALLSIEILNVSGEQTMLTIMQNITERKIAEEKLRISKEQYRSVVETQQELIVKVDMEGRFTFINDAYCRKFGVRREDMIGKNTFKPLVFEEDLPKTLEKMKELDYPPYTTKLEQRAYTTEGLRWIEWIDTAIKNEQDEIIEIQGVGRDIHDRKLAEEALKESQAKLLEAQKLARFGNYTIDIKNNNTIKWSDQMYDIWELDRNKPIPTFEHLWNLIHPDDREKVNKAISGSTKENNKIETEFRILFPDGRIKYIYLIATGLFDETGKLIKRQGVEVDITERKIAQIKLEEAYTQIEERLLEKEVLLREIFHRTKNNMQLISSLIGLKAAAFSDDGIKTAFEEMQNRIRAIALVHDKLYQSDNLSRVNLKRYIIDLLQLLMRSFFHKKIQLHYELEEIEVLIDIALPCGLIITELVLNSLKHAFPEDKIGIIEINLKRIRDNKIELTVSDNGIGLKNEISDVKGSVGLQLFKSIAESQLDAKIELKRDDGVKWIVQFSDDLYKERV